jgi:hypothetical protein
MAERFYSKSELEKVPAKGNFLRNCSCKNLAPGQMWKTTTKSVVEKVLWRIIFKFGLGDNVEYLYFSTKRGAEGYATQLAKPFKGLCFSVSIMEEAYPEKTGLRDPIKRR